MKKHILFSLAVILLSVIGCSKPNENGNENPQPPAPSQEQITIPSTVDVTPVVPPEGGDAKITFTAATAWTASVISTKADSWVDVNPKSGNPGPAEIKITTIPNDTYVERNATIQIKCGGQTKDVVLTQKQVDNITITTDKVELSADGGTFTIELKSNIDFSYEIKGDWIKYVSTKAYADKTLTFSAKANDGVQKREGCVTVNGGEFSETIKVYQSGEEPSLIISKNEYNLEAEGGSIAVEVSSNVAVAMTIPEDTGWLTENKTKSVSTSTFYLDVAANETYEARSAEITFSNEESGLSEKIKVNQKGKPIIHVVSVSLDKTSSSLKVGETVTITASVSPDDATEKTVTWSTTDATVATVSNGVVTAKAVGNTTITAKAGDKTAICIITVEPILVTGVSLDKASLNMVEGETATLMVTVKPDNATNKTVNWSSSNNDVATVDQSGKVSAVRKGETTITVTTIDGGKFTTCLVIVASDGNVENPERGEEWDW